MAAGPGLVVAAITSSAEAAVPRTPVLRNGMSLPGKRSLKRIRLQNNGFSVLLRELLSQLEGLSGAILAQLEERFPSEGARFNHFTAAPLPPCTNFASRSPGPLSSSDTVFSCHLAPGPTLVLSSLIQNSYGTSAVNSLSIVTLKSLLFRRKGSGFPCPQSEVSG